MPCVFCGEATLSNEHVWPKWLGRAAPGPKRSLRVLRRRTEHAAGTRSQELWPSAPYRIKVRAVCPTCNHGWMSDLEQEVRPLLEPMLHGQTRILDGNRQELLALWAFKTATMLEFVYPQERAIQPSHAAWVYKHKEPPPGTLIWIASYRGTAVNSFYRHDVMRPPGAHGLADEVEHQHDAPIQPPVAYGANFGVRHVAFQVFGTTKEGHGFGHRRWVAEAFDKIWPTQAAITWPPATHLDDHTLPQVLELFATADMKGPSD